MAYTIDQATKLSESYDKADKNKKLQELAYKLKMKYMTSKDALAVCIYNFCLGDDEELKTNLLNKGVIQSLGDCEYIAQIDGLKVNFANLKERYPKYKDKFKLGRCHNNCINAGILLKEKDAKIVTVEMDLCDLTKFNIPKKFHSYIELNDLAVDFTFGILMNIKDYEYYFNVGKFVSNNMSDILNDYNLGLLEQMSKIGISSDVYLLAREDLLKKMPNLI